MKTIKEIAHAVLFSSTTIPAVLGDDFELRKGKTTEDFKAAIKRGIKQGHAKTEYEINMVEVHLASVIKKKRQPKK